MTMTMKRTGEDQDIAYMRSLAAAVVARSPRYMTWTMVVLSLFVVAAVLWMSVASIDVVVRASGKVIPAQQLQIIQSLEGGIVSELLVREGQAVEVGEPLVKIHDIAFQSAYEETRLKHLELQVKVARLTAETHGKAFDVSAQLRDKAPELVQTEQDLYQSNKKHLSESVQILGEQLSQHQNQVLESQSKQEQIGRSLGLVREELALKRPLVKRGLVSRVDLLQLQKQENELVGELDGLRLAEPRLESAIEEARGKIRQAELDFKARASSELAAARAELSRLAESEQALLDRVERTVLRSPVRGTITRMHVNTLGGVVQSGEPILEIVPLEDALLVQVQIQPKDIADLSVGLPARLKFSAYDSAVHGSLPGEVRFISADTITENEESFYVARIRPATPYLGSPGNMLPIRVGMTTDADIVTEKRTILEYLINPLSRGLDRAMREP
ncbi:MAG: HlyD family type I secretion periplasmic adaptor subunit [Gammaproteobacteria bacterium]|nr:HlyD family type I secretion periplasmic adaptor subunit [Gammaproteobacteria bacterium]